MMEGWDIGRWVRTSVLVSLITPFVSCSYISDKRNSAFDAVKTGDTRGKVISAFDAKFVSKAAGNAYSKYDISGCQSPCVERLWFENIMSMDIVAWSIDLDKDGHVVDKGKGKSPGRGATDEEIRVAAGAH